MAVDVKLSGVSKTYGKIEAVRDISLEVERGEFLSLLGPSGCGKTTILRIIAGLVEPESGTVEIKGKIVNGEPPFKRNVGLVFQNYALFPHMSVFENIAYPLKIRKYKDADIKRKVNQVLELVKLSQKSKNMPRELSGGEQQRVALARAIVFEPDVLLLDEPLSALDLKLRIQMREELKRIQRELNITTIFVTHDQDEALSLSDRVAVMNLGKVEQVGTPVEIYEAPRTKFVATFVGLMNEVKGRVQEVKEQVMMVGIGNSTITVKALPGISPGDTVSIFVRPEKVKLSNLADASKNVTLVGRIVSSSYMGQYTIYEICIADDTVIKAVSPVRLENSLSSQKTYSVYVGWSPNDCYLSLT